MTKQRVKKIGVVKTALIVAIIGFFISLLAVMPAGIIMAKQGLDNVPGPAYGGMKAALLTPLLYAGVAFLLTAFTCLLYNWISPHTGGIEFETEVVEADENKQSNSAPRKEPE